MGQQKELGMTTKQRIKPGFLKSKNRTWNKKVGEEMTKLIRITTHKWTPSRTPASNTQTWSKSAKNNSRLWSTNAYLHMDHNSRANTQIEPINRHLYRNEHTYKTLKSINTFLWSANLTNSRTIAVLMYDRRVVISKHKWEIIKWQFKQNFTDEERRDPPACLVHLNHNIICNLLPPNESLSSIDWLYTTRYGMLPQYEMGYLQ